MIIKVEYTYRGKTYEHVLDTENTDRNFPDEEYMLWIDVETNHEINLLKDEDEFGEYFIDKNNLKVYAAVFEDIMQDTMPIDIVVGEDVTTTIISE